MKKAAPRTIPKPEEKPAAGLDIKLKRTQQVTHEKTQEEVKIPHLKHVDKPAAGGEVEHDGGEHQMAQLKHVDNKTKHEEVRDKSFFKNSKKQFLITGIVGTTLFLQQDICQLNVCSTGHLPNNYYISLQ